MYRPVVTFVVVCQGDTKGSHDNWTARRWRNLCFRQVPAGSFQSVRKEKGWVTLLRLCMAYCGLNAIIKNSRTPQTYQRVFGADARCPGISILDPRRAHFLLRVAPEYELKRAFRLWALQ